MALAREQKLTDLGGVVAAAAHELGTPLATIKLVSTELTGGSWRTSRSWPRMSAPDPAAGRPAAATSCAPWAGSGKDPDLHMRSAPFGAVVREAAGPHADRGIAVL